MQRDREGAHRGHRSSSTRSSLARVSAQSHKTPSLLPLLVLLTSTEGGSIEPDLRNNGSLKPALQLAPMQLLSNVPEAPVASVATSAVASLGLAD